MTEAVFFRLLTDVDKTAALSDAIQDLRERGKSSYVHLTSLASLKRVPGSPFAYWVSEDVRSKFAKLPSFETKGRTAKRGPSTGDDFRRVRAWWEVAVDDVSDGDRWVPFSKGGAYSRYYADVHLLVAWDRTRRTFLDFHGRPGRMTERPEALDYFFKPGLTWSRRSQLGFSIRVLPKGSVFGDKSPSVVVRNDDATDLLQLTGLMNSQCFRALITLQMAFGSYEAGAIQRTPVPNMPEEQAEVLGELALRCVNAKRGLDTANETSHVFCLPALLQVEGTTLQGRLALWRDRVLTGERRLAEYQQEIDDLTFQLYGIEGEDRRVIEESSDGGSGAIVSESDESFQTEDEDDAAAVLDGGALVADLLSYAVGCIFGRWDVRVALDSSLAPELADPFAPLPACSPGMLVGPDRLPASKDGIASEEWMRARPDAITPPPEWSDESATIRDSEYPLGVDWYGIMVDDPNHSDDVVSRVRDVLGLLWEEGTDGIEDAACDALGVKELRSYFRNPRRFFEYHIKRYSKSRRKAPIYWLLQSPKRNYGLWLYYPRLDSDILFKALMHYVDPKIRMEEARLEEYEGRRRQADTGSREARQAEKDAAKQEEVLADLHEFRDRLDRAAKLYLRPDLNDGVVLNAAPLHELVPWKEAKNKWDELLAGEYEWSSIGKQLRQKGKV